MPAIQFTTPGLHSVGLRHRQLLVPSSTEKSQGVVNSKTGIYATDTSHLFSCVCQTSHPFRCRYQPSGVVTGQYPRECAFLSGPLS